MVEPPILQAEALTKTYWKGTEKNVALDNVSLEVHQGEMLAVYGPSGSGKTTLLFILGGFDKPTSGRVFMRNVEISEMNEGQLSEIRRENIGFVFQNYNLVEELTARENIVLTMMFEGRPRRERDARAVEILNQVGLAGKERHRPSQLSAGEQQRVAIARAIANRPRVVLMDEPTGNLDQDSSRAVLRLVQDIIRSDDMTFIIATHNPEIVQGASFRLFLRGGQVATEPIQY